jgi:hypothetical protein
MTPSFGHFVTGHGNGCDFVGQQFVHRNDMAAILEVALRRRESRRATDAFKFWVAHQVLKLFGRNVVLCQVFDNFIGPNEPIPGHVRAPARL